MKEMDRLKNSSSPTSELLTAREEEVLTLIARGMANKEIAQQLGLSERTVHNHVSNVLSKLNLANRTQAALYKQKHEGTTPGSS